jgi:hypothetical protein
MNWIFLLLSKQPSPLTDFSETHLKSCMQSFSRIFTKKAELLGPFIIFYQGLSPNKLTYAMC